MGVAQDRFGGVLSNFLKQVSSTLSQSQTNGISRLGTLVAPVLPLFLSNNPLPNGYPWGTRSDTATNAYKNNPTTGVVRSFDWTLSRSTIAPDGFQQNVLLVNGAFPGPTIEANWGDTIQVTVRNNISAPEEGTAMHWHGFLQQGTPWEDGTPAVTQCPIPPQSSYTYRFKASLYGSSWYHSHYSGQYAGGVVGPIVIYGPSKFKYDVDLGPILVQDWYHRDYQAIIRKMLSPNTPPRVPTDNTLLQGKNNFNCSTLAANDTTPCTSNAGLAKFKFQTGKTHRLRFINSGAAAAIRISIDNHVMSVIANDFVPINPYNTSVITLGVGQRSDVLVKANVGNSTSAFWIRVNQSSCADARLTALGAIYYDKADQLQDPTSKSDAPADPKTCTNDAIGTAIPLYPIAVPNATYTETMDISTYVNASNITLWKFGGVSFRGDYNSPPLLLANLNNYTYPDQWNVRNYYSNSSVRIIINNKTPSPHPMHLHGFNMFVLYEGSAPWDGTIVNPSNPERRDVALVRPNGYLVLQFNLDNPGVWGFHCHIAWHASGGFFSSFIVQPDKITSMKIPSTVAQTCRDWGTWTQTNIPDQIDSGL